MEMGGKEPRRGDSELASLLLFHGCAMNGGLQDAFGSLSQSEIASAICGFSYFSLRQAANAIQVASQVPTSELPSHDPKYWAAVPDDGTIVHAFRLKLLSEPEAFGPVAQ